MSSVQVEAKTPPLATDLRELAQDIVRQAMNGGATAAECVIREGDEFSALVRLGQVETLKESGSRSIGVRVFRGQRAASTHSSDFSRDSLDRMVNSALELSKITSEDPFAGIPESSQLGQLSGDLDLYHEDVYSLPGADRSTLPRATKFSRTPPDSSANTGARIVRWPRFRSRRPKMARCSATTGFLWRER
jgi:PmbA protein